MKEIIPRTTPFTHMDGWKRAWHGYQKMEKVESQAKRARDRDSNKFSEKGEAFLEQQFFLNILSKVLGRVNVVELGAGRGDWCLATAGVVDFRLIDSGISNYRCLAVEAEPTHFKWMKEHFDVQDINAIPVNAAVWSENCQIPFYAKEDPADHYGQCVQPTAEAKDGVIKVNGITIDSLLDHYSFNNVDLMHVDVQGAELVIWDGAINTLERGVIKNIMIGTHFPELNDAISNKLSKYRYKTIYSAKCHSGINPSPFGDVLLPVDGLLVLELV